MPSGTGRHLDGAQARTFPDSLIVVPRSVRLQAGDATVKELLDTKINDKVRVDTCLLGRYGRTIRRLICRTCC